MHQQESRARECVEERGQEAVQLHTRHERRGAKNNRGTRCNKYRIHTQ